VEYVLNQPWISGLVLAISSSTIAPCSASNPSSASSHRAKTAEKESNWLPEPTGDFNFTMRVYSPKGEVIDGRWAPPIAVRINGASGEGSGWCGALEAATYGV